MERKSIPHRVTRRVFVNRTLNLKKIRAIGLDMDHTLIRYQVENFERLSHSLIKEKLVRNLHYPNEVLKLPFDYHIAIRGLVIDRKKGNLLKLNRHSAIRASHHGLKALDFKLQQKTYNSTYIDLGDPGYLAIDTSFSISLATLFAQLVDLKETRPELQFPDFSSIADDVLNMLDEAHRDGTLKGQVAKNLDQFVIKDKELVEGLEKFKKHGKMIFIVTNSDYHYTRLLLDYAINPFLKSHSSWRDLFEIVVTSAQKPRFFTEKNKLLAVNPKDGSMTNFDEKIKPGVYQGGSAAHFTKDLDLQADEILYIGDHIYGDILRLKKDCGWRTAMVIEELESEIENNFKVLKLTAKIDEFMNLKEPFEDELTDLMTQKYDGDKSVSEERIDELQKKISDIDSQISLLIKQQQAEYNGSWGQLMRAGNEESYFAYQVERYACVYMSKLRELFALSPRTYFRAPRKPLSHELLYESAD